MRRMCYNKSRHPCTYGPDNMIRVVMAILAIPFAASANAAAVRAALLAIAIAVT